MSEILSADERQAATAEVTKRMIPFAHRFITPVSLAVRDASGTETGKLAGSGSYIAYGGHRFLISNEHVAAERMKGDLCHQFFGSDAVFRLVTTTYAVEEPLDVAIWHVPENVWCAKVHQAEAIQQEYLAAPHGPVADEILFFMGYPGERSGFMFGNLISPASAYATLERDRPPAYETEGTCFALERQPSESKTVDGKEAYVPRPTGLSGSLVWNTRYVECLRHGVPWDPSQARVTGILRRAIEHENALIATKVDALYLDQLCDIALKGNGLDQAPTASGSPDELPGGSN